MKYIVVELSKTSFAIGRQVIGTKDRYDSVATCRSRNQAGTLVELLNEKDEGRVEITGSIIVDGGGSSPK